jgi:hypothetical protein
MIMKKITLLMMLLCVTFGFSQQIVVQDFENGGLGGPFGGAAAAIVADPETGGTRGNVAMLTASAGGQFFQGINIALTSPVALTTDKTMEIDVYSLTPISIAPKVINGADGSPDSTAAISHTGSGWETLIITFNEGLDNTVTANGVYSAFVIYYNWDTAINNFINPPIDRVFYVDNIVGNQAPASCSDGIQNQDETGIDCGGSCPNACPVPPSEAAPTPPNRPAADVFSVYSNAYTAEPSSFGVFGGGSVQDLSINGDDYLQLSGAPGANVQWQFGIPNGVDLSSFTHYHMDYYIEGAVPGEGAVWQTIIQGFDATTGNFTGNTLHNIIPTTTGVWLSLDIPISTFNGGVSVRDNIGQMQLAMAGPPFGPTYIDNVYFHKDTVLSTNDFTSNEFEIFPNPTKDLWNINSNGQIIQSVQVFDILGKQVLSLQPEASEVVVSASGLKDGIYLTKITTERGTRTIKLVKN